MHVLSPDMFTLRFLPKKNVYTSAPRDVCKNVRPASFIMENKNPENNPNGHQQWNV